MDRYTTRYGGRPRSPIHNPASLSLPINLAYPHEQSHLHVVPSSRREAVAGPRTSNSSIINAGTITTTYKVTADPVRGSSVRANSHTRRSTLDNHNRPNIPTIVTATPRHRPVVHSARPPSPMNDAYRSSQEEYVAIPGTSRHGGHHHHRKRYSAALDNGDMDRIAQENGRLRIAPVGRETAYTGTRPRQIFPSSLVRHSDPAEDYGDDGYGYTNASDLVRYDLNHSQPAQQVQHQSRRDSFEGGRRPVSISGYNDVAPRSYDNRERGPPPSMRGFDKLHGRAPSWDQGRGPAIMPVAPTPPSSMVPMEPPRSAFDPVESVRRPNSTQRPRPSSLYHDREPRRGPREDYYEVWDEEPRHSRPHRERYDDRMEDRGFGIRDAPERIERPRSRIDRPERYERTDRDDRPERYERTDRDDRGGRIERTERIERIEEPREHKGRDILATGLSLAGAALGVNAVKNAARGDRDDRDREEREERSEREEREREERRRERRDREARESIDWSGRDTKERRHRNDDISPGPRDIPQDREGKNHSPSQIPPIDLVGRAPRERQVSKDERDNRDSDTERRERHRHRAETALAGAAAGATADSRSDTSEDVAPRTTRRRRESGAAPGFNPKDALDLKALKDQLNAKEAVKPVAKEAEARTPRGSSTKDAREATEIRNDLNAERRSRDSVQPADGKSTRVVSPPREEVKPVVKGILRQPKEKFPEDPAPVREGVAPLKDAKKDGIPPDARWTKISRKLVNPEALVLGKERFESREDFVIVLRVLSRDEVQGYAEVTQKIRQNREELDELEARERRKKRRARHEAQKAERERTGEGRDDRERRHHRRDRDSESSTDSENGDRVIDGPKMLEAPKKRAIFEEALMSGGLGNAEGSVRETVPMPRSNRDER